MTDGDFARLNRQKRGTMNVDDLNAWRAEASRRNAEQAAQIDARLDSMNPLRKARLNLAGARFLRKGKERGIDRQIGDQEKVARSA